MTRTSRCLGLYGFGLSLSLVGGLTAKLAADHHAMAQPESPWASRSFCTERISVDEEGRASPGEDQAPTISADGRYVVFGTTAALEPGDDNDNMDLYLRDRAEGITRRVTWSEPRARDAGVGAGDAFLSADGQVLVYATRLNRARPDGPLVCSQADPAPPRECIVRRRLDGGPLKVLDVDPLGLRGDRHSRWPSVSADGDVTLFWSTSNFLDGRDFNDRSDVYRVTKDGESLQRISLGSGGRTGPGDSGAIGMTGADAVSVSRDGRWSVFASTRADLVPEDEDALSDVYLHDAATGALELVSVALSGSSGSAVSPSGARQAVSDDGRFVIFASRAEDLVPGDTNRAVDAFVRDRVLGRTERVNLTDGGRPVTGLTEWLVALSPDGRYAYFASGAALIVPEDRDANVDLFVRDRMAGRTFLISQGLVSDKLESAGSAATALAPAARCSSAIALLFPPLREPLARRIGSLTTRISKPVGLLGAGPAQGDSARRTWEGLAVSGDGLHVAFASHQLDLAPGADGSLDIYVRAPCDATWSEAGPTAAAEPGASATATAVAAATVTARSTPARVAPATPSRTPRPTGGTTAISPTPGSPTPGTPSPSLSVAFLPWVGHFFVLR